MLNFTPCPNKWGIDLSIIDSNKVFSMNKNYVWVVLTIVIGLTGCSQGVGKKIVLKNALDSASYALGEIQAKL